MRPPAAAPEAAAEVLTGSAGVIDRLTDQGIRDGHRVLLDTFRDLAFGDPGSAALHPTAADAAVVLAFLRQSVMPFARWEEGALGAGNAVAEDTAFEHAFLATEIDGLARALQAVNGRGSATAAAGMDGAVLRHLQRIEAILELHIQKAGDRERPAEGAGDLGGAICPAAAPKGAQTPTDRRSQAPDSAPVASGAAAGSRGSTRSLTEIEIRAFLRTRHWGVLATANASGRPYAVPVSYGFDGRSIYLAISGGRKERNLLENPSLCLTVVEVSTMRHWQSVVVIGGAIPVTGIGERATAIAALGSQRRGSPPSARDLMRLGAARLFRIQVEEMTGRGCG